MPGAGFSWAGHGTTRMLCAALEQVEGQAGQGQLGMCRFWLLCWKMKVLCLQLAVGHVLKAARLTVALNATLGAGRGCAAYLGGQAPMPCITMRDSGITVQDSGNDSPRCMGSLHEQRCH